MSARHAATTRPPPDRGRRRFVLAPVAAAAVPLSACVRALRPAESQASAGGVDGPTVDLHSHAGHVIPSRSGRFDAPFTPVASSMREGGMDVVCLAVVADTPVTRNEAGHIRAWREPRDGELYAWAVEAYGRARALIASEGLTVVTTGTQLRAAAGRRSGVIVASEGADFLEGRLERVDEFHGRDGLRHLQLTHYRVNALGDIQTAPPIHGGLTAFGRDVVRRCETLGIVVDVAHAPFETVRDVVAATGRPLVLSHTSLSPRPPPLSRLISPEHARLVASTGGVIGVWPPASRFPSLAALAGGIRDLVDVVGVAHVGLGSDMLGLTGPSIFDTYADLPALQAALRDAGFVPREVAMITGGNYARVFQAVVPG